MKDLRQKNVSFTLKKRIYIYKERGKRALKFIFLKINNIN